MTEEEKQVRLVQAKLDGRELGWNTCQFCGGTKLEVRNYDMMWHDGDVMCIDCGERVRGYDAG